MPTLGFQSLVRTRKLCSSPRFLLWLKDDVEKLKEKINIDRGNVGLGDHLGCVACMFWQLTRYMYKWADLLVIEETRDFACRRWELGFHMY
jgi:hypothetical protein